MEDVIRRYHLKSVKSYNNDKDLVGNYKKYLVRTGAIEAYENKFDDVEVTEAIKDVLQWNCDRDNLIIKDKHVEKWAKEEEVSMVNEY